MNMPLWFSNLLFWSAQVAVLVLVAALLPRLFQIRQPRVLLAYWRVLLLLTVVLPFVQPWHRVTNTATVLVLSDSGVIRLPATSTPPVAHWHLPNIQLVAEGVAITLVAGITLRFALLVLGLLRLRRLRQTSAPIAASHPSAATLNHMLATVRAAAEFRLSSKINSPVTFGMEKPVILLPEGFSSIDSSLQSAIACHELLHVRRRDWTLHLSEEILRAIFWFHPAIAWLISRVRLAREQVVDLEVIQLTNARKPYLEALLAFTSPRARFAAIPAPPFLAERQLVERISLMLKEVHMSRRKLVASLGVISCCLALVVGLSAWSFPLKRAPLQSLSGDGVVGGISGGIPGGISGGVTGGVNAGINRGVAGALSADTTDSVRSAASLDIPDVDTSTIWTDTVKKGPMVRQVRALGKLVPSKDSADFVAQLTFPTFLTADVKLGQTASVASQGNVMAANGHVSRIDPSTSASTRTVDIAFDAAPKGARAGLEIDGTIDIENLGIVLQLGRPVHAAANTEISVFKIDPNGSDATLVNVKFGRASVSSIEISAGLKEGDTVILSDMSQFEKAGRIHLTDKTQAPKH
jgi:beta-lactamase regulating signal transducer with metallopeptidase domain